MKEWLLEKPHRIPVCLVIWVLVFYGFALGSLEFLRHTEADRTLISWEMLERGRFLIPTLLHSEILTKPPLYYWCTAFWLFLFGTDSVAVARLTSLFAALLGVVFQYYVWLGVSGSRTLSGIMAFSLSTTVLYFSLGTVAEIDMLFGVLTLVSLSTLFLLLETRVLKKIILATLLGVSTAFAFLTKGPPVIFFLTGALGTYCVWKVYCNSWYEFFCFLKKSVLPLMFAGVVAIAVILLWLIPLGMEVGWEVLGDRLEEEVFLRVLDYSERGRGFHFYLGALLANGLPWSIFFVLGLYRFYFSKVPPDSLWTSRVSPLLEKKELVLKFFQYSLCVLFSGFIMLSIAQGKSSRYAFPLLPFLLNVGMLFSYQCLKVSFFKKLFGVIRVIFFFILLVSIFVYIFITLDGVSQLSFTSSMALVSLTSVVIIFSKPKVVWKNWFLYVAVVLLVCRGVYTLLYIPHRNATRSVKLLAENVALELQGSPVYTVEMFERWVVYYVKRIGIPAYRLTPVQLAEFGEGADSRTLLLLAVEEEAWRFHQLRQYDASTSIRKVFPHLTSGSYVLETSGEALTHLGLSPTFPTYPSIPFYPELAERNLVGK
jgi:4-amino-4-deoxy-L-arabinose transferase-like glycosyltransferase